MLHLKHQFEADWLVVGSMKNRIAIVLSALLLLGLGCDSSGSRQKLSVNPSYKTLNAGGAAVGFIATLTGSSSVIVWTLSGPGTISTTTGATTSYTPPASVTAATSATLLATAGSASGNATITINPAGTVPPTVPLEVNPMALVVTAGGAASNLTANLTGSSSAIAWTLTGPGTISTTTGATTSYTPPASVTAATAATLTATSGNASGQAMITINPSPGPIITVAGQILDLGGMPVANAPVAIGTQKTTTDASGHFTIAGVTTPYDLVTVTVWNGGQLGIELRGLTRTNPTIAFASATGDPPLVNQARVSGNLSGGDPLSTSGDYTYVAFGSPTISQWVSVINNPFDVFLEWSGPTSFTGNLHALQFAASAPSQPPTSYKGYGTKSGVMVTPGATQSGQDFALASVSTANISGSITLPSAAYSLDSKSLTLAFGDGASIPLGSDSALAFNYLMPSGIGATGNLSASATVTGAQTVASASGLAPDTSGLSLELHAAALPVLPADASTGVTTDTDFTWTAFDGGLHFVYFAPFSNWDFPTGPAYIVVTPGTTTKIPDLAALGIGPGLPAGASYSWSVTAQAPSTIDAFTSGSTSPADRTYSSDADFRIFNTQ
jgi:hypothetical protein